LVFAGGRFVGLERGGGLDLYKVQFKVENNLFFKN